MVVDKEAWVTAIGLSEPDAKTFAELASRHDLTPVELLRRMTERVRRADRDMRQRGLNGLGSWRSGKSASKTEVGRDGRWASAISVAEEDARVFEALAQSLGMAAAELLRGLVQRVVNFDDEMRRHGVEGLAYWTAREEAREVITDVALQALPMTIRESGFMWPADKPFPWTAEECRAAVLGYEVRWRGKLDNIEHVRGRWEITEGFVYLHQS
jgi:hypothetical protein